MSPRRIELSWIRVYAAAALLCAAAPTAFAQDAPASAAAGAPSAEVQWDRKRLDRLERNVERLDNSIARMKPDKAPPNLIEPDPEVIALTARLDELTQRLNDGEQTLRKVNGQLDAVSIELEKSRKAEAAARTDNTTLAARIGQLEARLAVLEQAAQAARTTADAPSSGASIAGSGPAAAEASGDPTGEFKSAAALLRGGDSPGAGRALEAWLGRWSDQPQVLEAHYLLGESYYAQGRGEEAAREYYTAVKTWPKAKWAPSAVVRLAASLDAQHQKKQACAAVAEFARRYAKEAAPSLKAQAGAIRTRNKCGA